MRQTYLLLIAVLYASLCMAQNVGIGTNSPNAAAKLEVQSANSGLLIPRLSTSQINAIASPPSGLLAYDNNKNLFSFYNGIIWNNIKPVSSSDSIWASFTINNEVKVFNAMGVHTYIDGLPMLPTGSQGIIDGALRVGNGYEAPVTVRDYLTMDGKGIQARTQLSNSSPLLDNHLLLNRYGGNVGIGVANPSRAKLELNGVGLGTTSAIFGGDGSGISLQRNWPIVGFNEYYDFNGSTPRYIGNGYAAAAGVNQNNGDFFIDIYDFGGTNNTTTGHRNMLTLKQNGNVGIGTLSPAHKLSVNGTIQSKEMIVETGWSDYVFEENYSLSPLNQLEEYIKKNKHLPGIPSAKEIQQNGLAVAAVNTKMMEKIEELTLYIIELNKKIEVLEKKINDQH